MVCRAGPGLDERRSGREEGQACRAYRNDDQARRREDASHPACVETESGSPSRRLSLSEQNTCNHEARDDKEHVHADVSTRKAGYICVEEDNEQDCDGP